jgi:small subunit ribosomal protein S16
VAVKLRLMRMGKKKQPTYRVVAADSRSPRDGRFIEIVGVYAPRGRSSADSAAVIEIDDAKAIRWLSQGAQPTDRVDRLFQQSGTWERFRTGAVAVADGAEGAEIAPSPEPGSDTVTSDSAADEPGSGRTAGDREAAEVGSGSAEMLAGSGDADAGGEASDS